MTPSEHSAPEPTPPGSSSPGVMAPHASIPGPVAVVGLGVLGSSVARGLRAADPTLRILGIEPDPLTGARARGDGVVEAVDASGEALLPEARTVVFAAPLSALPAFLEGPGRMMGSGALVLDLVGVNAPVLRRAEAAGMGARWVSGAPNLVTPETGYGAGDARLLRGVEVRLSVTEAGAAPSASGMRAGAEALCLALGASPFWMDPREHDALVAWTVLLPRVLAGGLAGALHAAGVPPASLPPQTRAMVALAATDPARWNDLLEAGAQVTGTGITSVTRAMNVAADLLAGRHVERVAEFLERARGWVEAGQASPAPGEGDAAGWIALEEDDPAEVAQAGQAPPIPTPPATLSPAGTPGRNPGPPEGTVAAEGR
jgi:prephenate dehydrogenase